MSRLQLYLDDTDPNIQYTPSTAWTDNQSTLWTSGHSRVPNQFPGATLEFTFNGTSAIFHGTGLNSSMFTPIIDGLPQANVTMPGSNPPTYGVWYRTPELQPGKHTVIMHDVPPVAVDYVIVEVDPSTVLQPTTSVLVSDSDPSIEYSGNWKQDFTRSQSLQPFTFMGDYSTRSSCNPGDSLSLNFSGTSIQLWGVFDWKSVGHVTAAYWVDGNPRGEPPYQAVATSQNSIFGVQTNFLLFEAIDLADGQHNIMVNITSCTNQRFSLDYITYTPSFNSGKDAPTKHPTTTKASHFPPGAIAGIVVGALVLAVVILILWFYAARRKTVTAPFPTSSPSVSVTRKEQVPAHMRQLRSPASRSTNRADTIEFTNESSPNEGRILAHNPSEVLNINELVAGVQPPTYLASTTGENAPQANLARRS